MSIVEFGPSGGIGGNPFHDKVPPGTTPGLVRISSSDDFVIGLQFSYVDENGGVIDGPLHGSTPSPSLLGIGGPEKTTPISLGNKAYIARISGFYGIYVDSLKITTIRDVGAVSGTPLVEEKKFGGPGGRSFFSYQVPFGYEVVGFLGKSATVIDAIGVEIRPLSERGIRNLGVFGENFVRTQALDTKFLLEISGDDRPPEQDDPPREEPPPEEPMETSRGPIKPR
jgi:hypothetical protein